MRIGVREETPLQQRIVAEINARDDMSGMEGRLFIFGKEVIRVAVEDHSANPLHRHQRLGDQLGGIEQVEVKSKFILFGDQLQAKLKFRVVPGFDGLPQIAAMKIGVAAGQLLRFIPHQRRLAGDRFPVKANEGGFALGINQTEGVDPEAFHGAIRGMPRSDIAHITLCSVSGCRET